MIKIYDAEKISRSEILNRGESVATPEIEQIVADIIDNVRTNGDKALKEYTAKFDGVELASLKVSDEEIEAAYNRTDKEFIKTLEMAAENLTAFHKHQVRENFVVTDEDGIVLGQKVTPIAKAGLYVPGGTASYPSSVLMDIIPAKIAGVEEIVMVSPPGKDGKIADPILAAAKVGGATAIYKVGGAQAIAALAYGTESIPKVDKIVGPGNIFVATAKRRVFGLVDIDMIAGPSEILVIADKTANPTYVAADLLSQAEHDKMATAVLVCDCAELAKKVSAELERQIPLLPREEIARTSIDNNGKIIIAKDLWEAIDISNEIAPEHLELSVDDPFAFLHHVKNAGSIFMGKNVPEAVGDYWAGPNHTLPTGGTAKFSSPLSVDEFVKKSSFIYYTKEALAQSKDRIIDFAEREQLSAHARSVAIRFEE